MSLARSILRIWSLVKGIKVPSIGTRDPFIRVGGGRGIRTHEELALLAVFKTAAIGH